MSAYRGIQECYWKWAYETTGGAAGQRMLAPSATTFASANGAAFTSFGYSGMPTFNINEQPVPIMSLGSYRLFNSYKGIRDYSLRAEITIGNWQFMQLALRSSGLGAVNGYKGLPVLAIALGSMDGYSSPFNWIARYCMIRELSFAYAPGQPVRATVDFVPLFIELTGTQKQLTESEVLAAGGDVLGWANTDWTVAGEDYTHWLTGVNMGISNTIQPISQRRDKGDDNPLSRVRRAIMPTDEQVNLNYNMAAELESTLFNDNANASLWGQVKLDAYNTDSGGSKRMTVTVDHNRLANFGVQGGQIGGTLNFSTSTLSGIVSITGQG